MCTLSYNPMKRPNPLKVKSTHLSGQLHELSRWLNYTKNVVKLYVYMSARKKPLWIATEKNASKIQFQCHNR